LFTNKTFHFI